MANYDYLVTLAQKSDDEIKDDVLALLDAGVMTDLQVATNRQLQPKLTREYLAGTFAQEHSKSFVNESGEVKTLDKKSPTYAQDLEALMDEGGWKKTDTITFDRKEALKGEGVRPAITIPVITAGKTKANGGSGQGRKGEDTLGSHEEYIAAVRELADEEGIFIGQTERGDGTPMKVVMHNDSNGNPERFGFPSAFKSRFAGKVSWRNENSVALLESLGY